MKAEERPETLEKSGIAADWKVRAPLAARNGKMRQVKFLLILGLLLFLGSSPRRI